MHSKSKTGQFDVVKLSAHFNSQFKVKIHFTHLLAIKVKKNWQ